MRRVVPEVVEPGLPHGDRLRVLEQPGELLDLGRASRPRLVRMEPERDEYALLPIGELERRAARVERRPDRDDPPHARFTCPASARASSRASRCACVSITSRFRPPRASPPVGRGARQGATLRGAGLSGARYSQSRLVSGPARRMRGVVRGDRRQHDREHAQAVREVEEDAVEIVRLGPVLREPHGAFWPTCRLRARTTSQTGRVRPSGRRRPGARRPSAPGRRARPAPRSPRRPGASR